MILAAFLGGCGQAVEPGRTHHRLYAWNCPRTDNGRAYLVLRYQDEWKDASKSTRVGLIKFKTSPEPLIIDDQYVWGIPTGGDEYVLFDAMKNEIVDRPGYVRRIELGGVDEAVMLAFIDGGGSVEVIRPDGGVIIPAESGYTDVRLAFEALDGTAVLSLGGPEGRWDLRDGRGRAVGFGTMLTTLEFAFPIGP